MSISPRVSGFFGTPWFCHSLSGRMWPSKCEWATSTFPQSVTLKEVSHICILMVHEVFRSWHAVRFRKKCQLLRNVASHFSRIWAKTSIARDLFFSIRIPFFRVLGRSRCIEKVFGFGVFGPRYGVLPRGRGPWCRVSKLDRDVFAKSYRFLAREKR